VAGFGFVIDLGTLAVIGLVIVVVRALGVWRVFRSEHEKAGA
jgi:hypothetical protein